MKVIIGLGNPGRQYAGTRHNVGFDVVDYLAAAPTVSGAKATFQAEVFETAEGGEKVLFVKPQTYMNLSGRVVRAILDFYKLTAADVLVICDDYNLPLGKLRVRAKGSHGGQNGLRDIQQQLGSDEYPRMRMGVGQPGPGEAVDFVLSRFKPAERPTVDDAIAQAAAAALVWVRQGLPACMNFANGPSDQSSEVRSQKPGSKKQKSGDGTQGSEEPRKLKPDDPVPPPSAMPS